MRFPSLVTLVDRAREVVVRFPWTMAAATVAAVAAIAATTGTGNEQQGRVAMVAALGLPLTVALTLFAEARGWSPLRKAALNGAGVALLILFYLVWPGPDQKHEAIRYFQLNAGLHLLVAALPFWSEPETNAFWQYNRRLLLGFLRANVFAAVLFVGLAIALGAMDKLFGVSVRPEVYFRLWIIIGFVVNTAIFLAVVPGNLRALSEDTSYPRVLKVFAQYILTPLVFTYLIILLAYLVKIVAGGEWPSGWIGWLVASVAVAGLLGFLLVHPLRDQPSEGWIRTYTRWLFVGLIPAALMFLVAFWKRILPYGLTEPRLLGILLGIWLLVIALNYTLRQGAGIRRIPVSLAILLLLTLYAPLSVTSLSVGSQGRRLARLVGAPGETKHSDREASAALRFLLEHGARRQIAAAFPATLPALPWDSLLASRTRQDSAASRILAVAGMRYVPEYSLSWRDGYMYLHAQQARVTSIRDYEWMLSVSSHNTAPVLIGPDSLRMRYDTISGIAQVKLGGDSLAFDLYRLVNEITRDSILVRHDVPAERLRLTSTTSARRAMLALESLSGTRKGDSLRLRDWSGMLFLGK
jgi:uncharacterized protein DUF4153